jgi:hypothetical protein
MRNPSALSFSYSSRRSSIKATRISFTNWILFALQPKAHEDTVLGAETMQDAIDAK